MGEQSRTTLANTEIYFSLIGRADIEEPVRNDVPINIWLPQGNNQPCSTQQLPWFPKLFLYVRIKQ